MSWTDVLYTVMRIIFVFIAGVTLIDYIKNRGQNRLDIHLIFLSIAIIYSGQLLEQVTGNTYPLWSTIGLMAFFAHPFLLLRLTTYFRTVPVLKRTKSIVWGFAFVGLVSSWLIIGFGPQLLPQISNLILILYFVLVESYASLFFIRGALKSAGVTKQRMRFVASGSGLLVLLFILICIFLVFKVQAVQNFLLGVFPVIIILSAICYYIGFLPPKKLRQWWKLNEIFDFQQRMATYAFDAKDTRILLGLCDVAIRVTGGSAALVLISTDCPEVLRVEASRGIEHLPETLSFIEGDGIDQVRTHHRSVMRTKRKGFTQSELELAKNNHTEAIMAVPIMSNDQLQGILVILLHKPPLFPLDDQRMLMLLNGHVAIRIAYDTSLAEQELLVKQLQQTNVQLNHSTAMKSKFLANMSHEFRTPLNAIIGFSEFIHEERLGPLSNHYKELMGDILTSSKHLLHLINDVLDLSKVEAGKMVFHPTSVNVSVIIREVRDIVRGLIVDKNMRVELDIAAELVDVVIDPGKLKQVLYNLLSNAIKFTPAEGNVIIRAFPEDEVYFWIEVEDTGIGIASEDIPMLFQEFQQLDSSTSKGYQGTGLGLALIKRIVEAQGGRVVVSSTPDEGSIFKVLLPRYHETALLDVTS